MMKAGFRNGASFFWVSFTIDSSKVFFKLIK